MRKTVQAILFFTIVVLAGIKFIGPTLAFVFGILLVLIFGKLSLFDSKKYISLLLKISVVGLGFGISADETLSLGKMGLMYLTLSVLLTLGLGYILLRLFKIDKTLGVLLTSGTSICGGSAIAAIAPIIKAKAHVISISIAVIFSLNAIALLTFPWIGHALDLSETQFGMWCALAIHDTSSVVGAAMEFGDEALQTATTLKLARTLWIIPLSFLAMVLFKTKNQRIKIPIFIIGYIIAMLLNTYNIIPQEICAGIVDVSKRLLVITLLLVGVSLTLEDIKNCGPKPIVFSTVLWLFISVFSLVLILSTQ